MEMIYRDITKRIGELNILHRIYIHRAAAEYGVYSGQIPILQYISSHENCTQKQLADFLQVSAPSIATSVKRMQKSGLIQKTADEGDLRCNRLSATEKGNEISRRAAAAFNTINRRMFEGFTQDECKQFYYYLNRMTQNLESDEFKDKTMFALIDTMTAEKNRLFEQKGENKC